MIWVGKDKIGAHKGMKTLFIATPTITYTQIEKILGEYRIDQIYFGVLSSEINYNIVKKCLKEKSNMIITVEVDINKLHLLDIGILQSEAIEFVIVHNHKNYSMLKNINKYHIQIKLQNLDGDDYVLITDFENYKLTYEQRKQLYGYKGDVILK